MWKDSETLDKWFDAVEPILMDEVKSRGHQWMFERYMIVSAAHGGFWDWGMFHIYHKDKVEKVKVYQPYENPLGLPGFEHRMCKVNFSNVKKLVDELELYLINNENTEYMVCKNKHTGFIRFIPEPTKELGASMANITQSLRSRYPLISIITYDVR